MSEYTPYDEQKVRRQKRAKVKPKTIFGIFCGTFFLFIISFLLSYMLMNHNLPVSGTKSLAEENEELKERIEMLEERLEKYEDVDDFSKQEVPDKYTGATITPGGSEPAINDIVAEDVDEDEEKDEDSKNNDKTDKKNNKKDKDEDESAFDGIIDDDEEVPASTGISDAPVILN